MKYLNIRTTQLITSLLMAAAATTTFAAATAANTSPALAMESRNVTMTGTDSAGFEIVVASRFDSEPQNDPEAEMETELMLLSLPDLVNRPKR